MIFAISGALPTDTLQDGIFAFWLSLDDCAGQYDEKAIVEKTRKERGKDWKAALDSKGYSRLSTRPDFKGVGLVFLPFDAQRKLRRMGIRPEIHWKSIEKDGKTMKNLWKLNEIQ